MLRESVQSVFLLAALVLTIPGPVDAFDANKDPSLVGWWKLDDGGGMVAVDSSPSGNDGTLEGDPQWVTGWLDGALEFDGDDYVDTGNSDDLATYTFGVWTISPAAPSSDAPSGPIHRENNYQISWNHSNATYRGTAAMNVGGWHAASFGTLEGETWYHLAASYDGEVFKSYKNGQLVTSNDAPSGPPNADGNTLKFARHALATTQFFTGTVDDVRVYNRALTEEEIQLVMMGGVPAELAADPRPENEAIDVPRDVAPGWEPGEFARTHDVYFGTNFGDVNDAARANPMGVLVSENQTALTYEPKGVLEFGQTYYWRVDEVNAAPDNTIFKGEIWSFTVEPLAYPITSVVATSNGTSDGGVGPERTVDGSGLNADDQHSTVAADMWLAIPGDEPLQVQYKFDRVYKLHELVIWNYNVQFELMLGFGLKDVTVEYSGDGVDWTVLGDVELAQATARPDYTANTTIAFDGVAAQYVRLTVNSGYGMLGQYGLSEVRFMYIPAFAREPDPAAGDTGVTAGTALNWRAGREAVTHDVYLGTEPNALTLVDSVSETTYVPGDLLFGSTYYWRIDEVNKADAISVWAGDLWDFMVEEFVVIDDMESYDDEDNRIYDSWLDGWVNETGSTVGYLEAPFAEKTIVNSGTQSMPLAYDNSAAPFYSEAEFDVGGVNWNSNGADMLRLFLSGLAPDFSEAADGTILMNAIGTDIWGTGDQFRFAYKSLTGDGSLVARVDSLDVTPDVWVKAGVMIRQDTSVGSQHSFMPITGSGGNGASWQGRLEQGLASVNQDNAGDLVAAPYWVRIDRSGNTFTGFISPDGETWTQIGDSREVVMNDPVLIGLALTSHNANQPTSAQFSNVSFTGNVSGAWQMAAIGATQRAGNDPEPVYLALEDNSGSVAVVTCPADPPVSAWSEWYEWVIPYSELNGINLNSVATMYIGVGDRDNPTSGGAGLIFIDDIEFGRPAAE